MSIKDAYEFRKYNLEDLEVNPKCFANEQDGFAKCAFVDMYGMLFPNSDGTKKPVYYFRHGNPANYRYGSFFEPSDDYNGLQKPLHFEDMAQKDTPMTNTYGKLGDDVYGYGTTEPFSEYRFYKDHATFKEGDFFDVVAEPFPYALVQHRTPAGGSVQIGQPCIVRGTYEGKPVAGVCGYDRVYVPQTETRDLGSILAYILSACFGLREDGRREAFTFYESLEGKTHGYYWLEGEEPIVSDNIKMEAEWYHVPYVSDKTVNYKDCVFHIADKTIHFTGKWGSKGVTAYPTLDRHGQSQVWGTFYEGDKPYNHQLFMTFNEQMEAYDYNIEKLGFKIID